MLSLSVISFSYYLYRSGKRSGKDAAEKEHDKKVIDNVKKANDAVIRLDDDKRKRLREKYLGK